MPDSPRDSSDGSTFDVSSCLERVARRDQDAARDLVEHFHPLVVRIARAHRPRSLPVDDLVQEVFLKVFRRLDRYRVVDGIPFSHWLSRVAVRTCLDALRAERRRPTATELDLSTPAGEWLHYLKRENAPPPVDEQVSARELVDALLRRLPPRDRLILSLLDMEERSVREVSDLTGWSMASIKVRAFRARRKLRRIAEGMEGSS